MQRRSELPGQVSAGYSSQGQFSGEAHVAIAVKPDHFPAEHDAVGMDRAAEPAGDHGDPTPLPRQDQRQRLSNFAVRDAAFVANVEAGSSRRLPDRPAECGKSPLSKHRGLLLYLPVNTNWVPPLCANTSQPAAAGVGGDVWGCAGGAEAPGEIDGTERGKTTLLLFLLAQAEKLGVTVVFFDKDRGGEILSRALGGTYLVLPSGQPTGMAPLRALSDTPEDRDFLIGWVTHLLRAGGYSVLPDDSRRIAQGVRTLLRLPPQHRSLSELRSFLGQQNVAGAGAHLERWCAARRTWLGLRRR